MAGCVPVADVATASTAGGDDFGDSAPPAHSDEQKRPHDDSTAWLRSTTLPQRAQDAVGLGMAGAGCLDGVAPGVSIQPRASFRTSWQADEQIVPSGVWTVHAAQSALSQTWQWMLAGTSWWLAQAPFWARGTSIDASARRRR